MEMENEENGSTVLPVSDVVPETSAAVNIVSDPISEPKQQQETTISSSVPETTTTVSTAPTTNPVVTTAADKRWPGWPGDTVFRLIVPVVKVGSIIGRKGELIKKICEETRARIKVLEGAIGTTDRIVLISGKEEPEVQISPAMGAVIRVFKRIAGLSDTESDGTGSVSSVASCSIRFLVPSSQALNLIGKHGSLIKSIQEGTGATVRVISGVDELPLYATSDERIIDIHGESTKVLKALEAVVGHLRKFLVDHSVIPLFEKIGKAAPPQDRTDSWVEKSQSNHHISQTGVGSNYPTFKRESLYLDHEMEPQMPHAGLSLYGQDPALAGLRPSGLIRSAAPIVTQITQTMQIPLSYAEDIIGIGGANIEYIRCTSGAILTVQESRGLPDEITVEIKGTSSQVQTAQQLIQEFMSGHKDPVASSYGKMDTGLRSYSQLGNSSYPSSLSSQSLGGYGSSGVGGGYSGYSGYRL